MQRFIHARREPGAGEVPRADRLIAQREEGSEVGQRVILQGLVGHGKELEKFSLSFFFRKSRSYF